MRGKTADFRASKTGRHGDIEGNPLGAEKRGEMEGLARRGVPAISNMPSALPGVGGIGGVPRGAGENRERFP